MNTLRRMKDDGRRAKIKLSIVPRPSSIITCIFLLALLLSNVAVADEWNVIKSQHFLVYYLEDKDFAKEVSRRAEHYYDRIAFDLGYSRYDKFWQWENRVKIYVYPTYEEFMRGTGIPREWAKGVARYTEKEIISFRWNKGFLDGLLPHELTHLIFRDFVGFPLSGGGIPLWIDEGIAQWAEKSKREEAEKIVKELIRKHSYIPLRKLTALDVRKEDNYILARNFYAEAVSLIGFMIEKYGGIRFTQFCRALRDGKSIDKALNSAYGNSIGSIEELERKWIEYYGGR